MQETLEKTKKARIAVIGDIMLDRYITGNVTRISPEAPVPVVLVEEETCVLGGAGNVVANLCKLGVTNIHLFCCISDDPFGVTIKTKLDDLYRKHGNIETTYFGAEQTITKTRIMADNHQIVRLDRETPKLLEAITANKIVDTITGNISNFDVILISDYGKGCITPYFLSRLSRSIEARIPICIDPSPKTNYPPMLNTIILPNTTEKMKMHDPRETPLNEKFLAVVETAGAEGIYIHVLDEPTKHIRAIEISDVVCTIGAGDTVTSVFTAAYGTGATMYEAAMLANIAASVVVRHTNTYAVSYAEIFEAINY